MFVTLSIVLFLIYVQERKRELFVGGIRDLFNEKVTEGVPKGGQGLADEATWPGYMEGLQTLL